MSDSFDVEEFVRQFTDPAPRKKRKPAAEIMMAPVPIRVGPRLDRRHKGRKRWVTTLDRRAKNKRFTMELPML